MTQPDVRVGFVGVGRMGANMARRLKEKEYQLTAVCDQQQAAADALAKELSCESATTPARVAERSHIVLTVVSDDAAMREIYTEGQPRNLLAFANGRLFINCATITPQVHAEIEALVERHGGASLEACMAGSIEQARQGTLYLMCGGKQEVFDRAKPLLESLSASLQYIGKAGEAAKVKTLVNMVMNCNTVALAEGLGLGEALGLDLTMLRQVFSQTGAASRVLETDAEDMQQRAHDCYFSAAHAAKDSGIALALAETVGLRLPVARATFDLYQCLIAIGKGQLDKSGISEMTFKKRIGEYDTL